MKVHAICSKCGAKGIIAKDQILTKTECCIDGAYLCVENTKPGMPKTEQQNNHCVYPMYNAKLSNLPDVGTVGSIISERKIPLFGRVFVLEAIGYIICFIYILATPKEHVGQGYDVTYIYNGALLGYVTAGFVLSIIVGLGIRGYAKYEESLF